MHPKILQHCLCLWCTTQHHISLMKCQRPTFSVSATNTNVTASPKDSHQWPQTRWALLYILITWTGLCGLRAGTHWDTLGWACMLAGAFYFCCSAIWKHSKPSAVRRSPELMVNDSPVFAQPNPPHTSSSRVHHTTNNLPGHPTAPQGSEGTAQEWGICL